MSFKILKITKYDAVLANLGGQFSKIFGGASGQTMLSPPMTLHIILSFFHNGFKNPKYAPGVSFF